MHHKEAIYQTFVSLTGRQKVAGDGQSVSMINGFSVPGVVLLNSWPHSVLDFSKHSNVHPNQIMEGQRSKLGFYVPFNSQGHIGTGPQNCHLWDSNPQR